MAGHFSSKKYAVLANELHAALAWLHELGVSYARTRVGEYCRALDVLIASFQKSNFDAMRNELLRFVTALFEIHDLIDIHKSLAGQFDNELRQHVEALARGPISYTEENSATSSNRARNIAFELVTMAKLVNAGIPLDFSIKTDVAAVLDKRSLLFESKRPQSLASLEKRVKDAFAQLEAKYRSPQRLRHRGLIAIDISKLINPRFHLYVQEDADAIDAGLSQIVDDFIAKHEHVWQTQRNKKTIGVMLRMTVMGVNRARNEMFTHCQQWGLSPINHVGERNIETVRGLAERLHEAVVHVV